MIIPALIAHRGYSAKYPENTLASIEAALDAGARYIEFDIQMMADDEFILMHDNDLQRCSGIKKSVFSLTRTTVRNFHADYYSIFSGQFSGIKIPLLEHAISLFKQFPEAVALIEVKEESVQEFGLEHVMNQLLPMLRDIKNRCYIISFVDKVIEYTQNNSDIKTGYVLPKYNNDFRSIAERLKPSLLICNFRKLPEFSSNGLLPDEALWPGDWQWALYEIDNAELALQYGRSGIDFIETNQIAPMLQHSALSSQVVNHNSKSEA